MLKMLLNSVEFQKKKMHNNSKIDAYSLGLDASLVEAAKKMKEGSYNPTSSIDDLKSEPNGSLPDAMTHKMNIADGKKHNKTCKCESCAMDMMKPGYDKTDRGYA